MMLWNGILKEHLQFKDAISHHGGTKMDILDRLNRSQTEAVTATEGYIRVIAGAGSGKTRALSHRFAFLVNEIGILPGNILCVTFTNKSANEMRQRIHNLTGDNDTGYINTFTASTYPSCRRRATQSSIPRAFWYLTTPTLIPC